MNVHITCRAQATGKKSRWVRVGRHWFKADQQWNPKGKPMEPCGLRDALDRDAERLATNKATP